MGTRIRDTTVVSMIAGAAEVMPHHDVVFEDNTITAVRPTSTVHADPNLLEIDGSAYVTIPGLINTHHHLYQTLTRGLKAVQNAPLFTWLTELYQRWERVDYEAVRVAAKVSIAELLLSGCCTTSDHFYLFPRNSDVRLEAVIEAAEELGIRIHACRGSMTVGKSKGGLPPDTCTEDEDKVLADCRRAVESFHDPSPDAMCKIDLAPCAPFNVSEELFGETASLARSLGVLLHTHAAETHDEQRYCQQRFGRRPIEYLADRGWLGSDVYLAHCVCLNEDDIQLLADTQTAVAHCPCSNMRLASGTPPISKLLRHGGIRVGLGVDGSSSNDGGHLLAEARQALLLQRVGAGAEALGVSEAFALATTGGAACLRRDRLGCIAKGYCADLALYNSNDIALAGAIQQDPLGALMLCHVPRAEIVIVDGQRVVEGGRLVRVDQDQLAQDLNDVVKERFCW